MRQARFGTQTADNASVHGGNAGASGSLSASLNTGPAIDEIQETKFAARDKLKVDVDSSIGTGEQAMGRMETGIKAAKKASLADFELAQKAVIAREKELKASVAATADATMDTWGRARQRVAVAFSAYAAALAQAQLKATEASTGSQSNGSATAALAVGSTPAEISGASLQTRDTVDADLKMKVDASEKAMAQLADRSDGMGDERKGEPQGGRKGGQRQGEGPEEKPEGRRPGRGRHLGGRAGLGHHELQSIRRGGRACGGRCNCASPGSANIASTVK